MNNKKLMEDINNKEIDFLIPAQKKGFVCPLCGNGSKGKTGTGIILNDKVVGKKSYKCFSCGVSGDTLDWWLYNNNLKQPGIQANNNDFIKGMLECAKYYNLNLEDYQEPTQHIKLQTKQQYPPKQAEPQQQQGSFIITHIEDTTTEEFIKGVEYLNKRHIKLDTAQENNVFISDITNKSNYHFTAITQENINNGTTIRAIDSNQQIQKANNGLTDISFFFNGKEEPGNYIFVVEGIFDSLTISELGFDSICLNSLNNLNKLYEYLNQHKTEYLYKSLIVCLDNDSAGNQAIDRYKNRLFDLNLDIRYINLCGDTEYKDINNFLIADNIELNVRVNNTVGQIKNELIQNNKDTFLYWWNNRAEEEKRLRNKRFSTGLLDLDFIIGGGLPIGLTVLGALSSLGKTTLLSQIAENIASKDKNVLFFSLEQGQIEIFNKGLFRNLFLTNNKHLQADSEINVNSYLDKIKHYYNVISGDFNTTIKTIDNKIQQIKNYSDNDIVVIIDYLQALKPVDEKGRINYSDKQATDNIIQSLKILSKNYNIPILAISSIGRDKYYNRVEIDSFKESGNIEYTADILLGMDLTSIRNMAFNGKSDKEKAETKNTIAEEYKKDIRNISITVLKNRNGKTRQTADLKFYTNWSVFTDSSLEQS